MDTLYFASENSDQTEGRGSSIVTGIYTDPDEAVAKVQGRGGMGQGAGEVHEIRLVDGRWEGRLLSATNRLYGYRIRPDGRWDYGYVDGRDLPMDDPEYRKFLELKAKFDRG